MSDLANEEWRPIPGCEGLYSVSNLGRVRSEARKASRPRMGDFPVGGHMLKTPPHQGYPRFNVRVGGKTIQRFVHRVVMLAFVGPAPEGQEVRHKDGQRANCCLSNLDYGTRQQNVDDAKRHKTIPRGEAKTQAVLSEEDVLAIMASNETCRVLASRYGVADITLSHIRSGRSWKHMSDARNPAGYAKRGEAHPGSKLTAAQALEIFRSTGNTTAVARQFGVNFNVVKGIRAGRMWKHVTSAQIQSADPSAIDSPETVIASAAE